MAQTPTPKPQPMDRFAPLAQPAPRNVDATLAGTARGLLQQAADMARGLQKPGR